MFIIIPDKKKKGLCCAYRCRKKPAKRDRFCPMHRHRFRKHNDPEAYTFYALKSNAKRRGIEFTLTLMQFREFCQTTGYIEKKGKHPRAMTIDRHINSIGYTEDNIRCISLNENSSKSCYEEPPF